MSTLFLSYKPLKFGIISCTTVFLCRVYCTNPLQISPNKLATAICGADRIDSARSLFESLKNFNVKDTYNFMICYYFYKSMSRSEIVFIRIVIQHKTGQTLNQVLYLPHTYSTQTMHSITYSGPRVFNTVFLNIRRCESIVTLKYRLKAHILSNNGG